MLYVVELLFQKVINLSDCYRRKLANHFPPSYQLNSTNNRAAFALPYETQPPLKTDRLTIGTTNAHDNLLYSK